MKVLPSTHSDALVYYGTCVPEPTFLSPSATSALNTCLRVLYCCIALFVVGLLFFSPSKAGEIFKYLFAADAGVQQGFFDVTDMRREVGGPD